MQYYVKSFEDDFVLKTIKGKKKVPYQSIQNIIKTKTLRPNTLSFGHKHRLACTNLHRNYTKTYRAQGLIFKTKEKPKYVFPFDLVLLTNAKRIIVQYYRIENNLSEYYNHDLIKGWKKFVFNDFHEMLKKVDSPEKAWHLVNKFRMNAGFDRLPISKYKLVQYNECVYEKPITIEPIAVYGYKKEAKLMAKKLNLPYYRSAKAFYNSITS